MDLKTWTLTDNSRGIWEESFRLSAAELDLPSGLQWTISKRTLRGGLCEGVDIIEVDTGAMSFSILPTRGMGIWRGDCAGDRLGWESPVRGPVHPQFVNLTDRGGLGWVAGFDEWIVRCGLDSNGAPGEDVIVDNNGNPMPVTLGLHGKVANLPAHFVELKIGTEPPFEIEIVGHVREAFLFGPNLELHTRILTQPGTAKIRIDDRVVNRGATAAELQLLYHCNFGPPFLDANAKLLAPFRAVAPRDARAAEGMSEYDAYLGPTPGYVEQVYWYELLEDPRDGRTLVCLQNSAADRAVAVRFDRRQLPCFSQWKNTGAIADGYVTGLEPGTNFPNNRRFEREQGRVPIIDAGESYQSVLDVEVYSGADAVADVGREIATLQEQADPIVHSTPAPGYSDV